MTQLSFNETISLEDLNLGEELGKGGFGKVKLVTLKKYPEYTMALKKIFVGPNLSEDKRLTVEREAQILEKLEHPSIVKIHTHFFDKDKNSRKQEN